MPAKPHISVCICTFKRAEMLRRLLHKLTELNTGGLFTFSAVVVDNDRLASAREIVENARRDTRLTIDYDIEPEQNIALARNRAVRKTSGEFIAFIDDDEFPSADWLLRLYTCIQESQVSGVLAPVLPHFDVEPPRWVKDGKFYDRPRHQTGFVLNWPECRTGNVLLRSEILPPDSPPFRPQFGTGGEDQDFFRALIEGGHRFVWCDEATVWETVPPERWDVSIMLQRALLRGKNGWRHKGGRLKRLSRSFVAAPLYLLLLPLLFCAGRHHFINYLVRLCDHVGCILASVNFNPISKRVG